MHAIYLLTKKDAIYIFNHFDVTRVGIAHTKFSSSFNVIVCCPSQTVYFISVFILMAWYLYHSIGCSKTRRLSKKLKLVIWCVYSKSNMRSYPCCYIWRIYLWFISFKDLTHIYARTIFFFRRCMPFIPRTKV